MNCALCNKDLKKKGIKIKIVTVIIHGKKQEPVYYHEHCFVKLYRGYDE